MYKIMKKLLFILLLLPVLVFSQGSGGNHGYIFKNPSYANVYNRLAYFDTYGYLFPLSNGVGYLHNNNGVFSFQNIDLSGYATQSWVSSNFDNYQAWFLYSNNSLHASIGSQQSVNFLNGDGISVSPSGSSPIFNITHNLNLPGLTTIVNPTTSYYVPVTGGASNTKVTILTLGNLAAFNATKLYDFPISTTDPTLNQVLQYNGSEYVPTTLSGSTNYWTLSGSNLYPNNATDNVAIGTNNTNSYKLNVNGVSRISSSEANGSLQVSNTSTGYGLSVDSYGTPSIFSRSTSLSNSTATLLELNHSTDVTASSGFGGNIGLGLETGNGAFTNAAMIYWDWNTTSPLTSRLYFYTLEGATTMYPLIMTGNSTEIKNLNVVYNAVVNGSVKVGNDSASASSSNVGAIRYRTSGNNSYCEMVMQTGASTYAWTIIKQNSW